MQIVEIGRAVLQEDSQWLLLGLTDQGVIVVSAANVGEAADVADDSAKLIGAFPCDGERTDASRTDAARTAACGIVGQFQLMSFAQTGQRFLNQEPCVLIAKRVIFEAAVAPPLLIGLSSRDVAGIQEDANRDGHLFLVNQIVEHNRCSKLSVRFGVVAAVLKDHHTRGLRAVVLRRNINPIVAFRAGKDLLTDPLSLRDLSHGDPHPHLRIGTELVVVGCEQR